jgi:hypothetical protein
VKNRVWIVLLVVSLGINIGFLLHWFWPKIVHGHSAWNGGSQCGWHTSSIRHGFGLSAEQTRLMENERRQVLAQAKPLQDELRLKRRALFVLLKSKAVPDAELDVILSEIARLQSGIEKMYILHTLKVRGYFSPQQLQKYEEFFEQGLCPGMMSGKNFPPEKMDHPGHPVPACGNKCEPKR